MHGNGSSTARAFQRTQEHPQVTPGTPKVSKNVFLVFPTLNLCSHIAKNWPSRIKIGCSQKFLNLMKIACANAHFDLSERFRIRLNDVQHSHAERASETGGNDPLK